MATKETHIPVGFHDEILPALNGVKFTHREIDIITLIFHTRGSSKIACLLSISTRTVETHTANIMRKMDANSREGIIDFVEKSDQLPGIKKHYRNLLNEIAFKKRLNEISKVMRGRSFVCSLIGGPNGQMHGHFISSLKNHLALCGIQVILTDNDEFVSSSQDHTPINHTLYILPQELIEKFHTNKDQFFQAVSHLMGEKAFQEKTFTFIGTDKNTPISFEEFGQEIPYVSFEIQNEGYYCSFFKVLGRIFPELNIDKVVADIKVKQETDRDISEITAVIPLSSLENDIRKKAFVKKNIGLLAVASLFFIIFGLKYNGSSAQRSVTPVSSIAIRSDLIIPTNSTFLDRPHLLDQIEKSLNSSGSIQTLAIIGVGGAGKTTIARKYALKQKANIVWEINAATRENLREAFERLAYDLCKTEEEKMVLKGLQNIKNNVEKDQKILLFVKERMKKISNWILIYDNVEKFTDIQNYFPGDETVWGNGKVIVTTSNSNAKNNNLIHHFLLIGELSPQEKLELFIKIMNEKNDHGLTQDQKDQAYAFLKDIPPYPLDVSIAAYYLKSTNTPYGEYLEKLKENRNDFDMIQANVVKEASGYTKTRYSIITLSTKELITINKNFLELLLLISLTGHQNIPKSLLIQYKGHAIADNFIYHLKKYSLVTNDSFSNSIPTISIHQKTQETILSYLTNTLPDKSSLLASTIAIIENYIFDAVDKEDFSRMKLLANHGEILLNRDDLLDEATKSSLKGALGCIYYYLRHYPKIKQFLEENLVDMKLHYGDKNDKIARMLIYLGNFYRSLGNYERAKSLLEQSLVICKGTPNHIRKAKALGYLGTIYRDLGNYQQAKSLFEQSLVIYEKHYPNSIGHAWILTYVGNTYRILGNYEKAKGLLEKSFSLYKEASEDYVGAAWALGYLGTVHRLLGDYQIAKDYIKKALLIAKKHFSDDHIYVARHMASLAKVYIKIGDYEAAKALLKTSLNVYKKNYGKNHVETAGVLRTLGEAYLLEGELEASEEFINKSLLIYQQKNSPEVFKCLESLACLYLKKSTQANHEGEKKRAMELKKRTIYYFNQSLDIVKAYFPENSPHAIKIQSKLNEFTQGTE